MTKRLGIADVAALFGVSNVTAWRWVRRAFPERSRGRGRWDRTIRLSRSEAATVLRKEMARRVLKVRGLWAPLRKPP